MGAKSLKIVFLRTFPGFDALVSLRFRTCWVEVGGHLQFCWEQQGLGSQWQVGLLSRELQGKPTAWSKKRQIGIADIS